MVKEFENTGYWAIILGGSSGLGLASAKKLATHGINICIVHRNARTEMDQIQIHFNEIKSTGVKFMNFNADALNKQRQIEILSELKNGFGSNESVRCMVHSIAKGNLKTMLGDEDQALSDDDFHITLDAMAISLYNWTKAVFNAKMFSEDARIISFTSEGSTKAWHHYGAVSAAKAALEAISRNIALEFAPYGIRCNCIQAGVTDTQSLRMIPGNETIIKSSEQRNPFKRLTNPEDVANVVYLLCKKEASWINGTVIHADGGEHLQ